MIHVDATVWLAIFVCVTHSSSLIECFVVDDMIVSLCVVYLPLFAINFDCVKAGLMYICECLCSSYKVNRCCVMMNILSYKACLSWGCIYGG